MNTSSFKSFNQRIDQQSLQESLLPEGKKWKFVHCSEALANNPDLRAAAAQIGLSEQEAYRMLVGREGQVVRRAPTAGSPGCTPKSCAQRYLAKAVFDDQRHAHHQ